MGDPVMCVRCGDPPLTFVDDEGKWNCGHACGDNTWRGVLNYPDKASAVAGWNILMVHTGDLPEREAKR